MHTRFFYTKNKTEVYTKPLCGVLIKHDKMLASEILSDNLECMNIHEFTRFLEGLWCDKHHNYHFLIR